MKHNGIPLRWWPIGGVALFYVVLLAAEPHPSPFQELYLQTKMAEEGVWLAVVHAVVFPIAPLGLRTTGQNPGRDRIVEEIKSRQERNNGTERHCATLAG